MTLYYCDKPAKFHQAIKDFLKEFINDISSNNNVLVLFLN